MTAAAGEHLAEVASAVATVLAVAALCWALVTLVRRPRPRRLVPTLVVVSAGSVLTFVAYIAFALRCPVDGCHTPHRRSLAHIDPWSSSMKPWQWSTELALASAGLAIGALALALAARGWRGARPALWSASGLYAAWVAIAIVVPALS